MKRLGGCRRLIVFDPLGEWAQKASCCRVETVAAMRDEMARRWRRGFRLALVSPKPGPDVLDDMAGLAWHVQGPWQDRPGPALAVVVDEANLGLPNKTVSASAGRALRLVLQGRHRHISVFAVTQRPALIDMNFRGQVGESVVFPLVNETDRRLILEQYGRKHAEELAALVDHRYMRFTGADVQRGANQKPK